MLSSVYIATPNEITGSVDEVNQKPYVSASGSSSRAFRYISAYVRLPTQQNLDSASFDLACRIFAFPICAQRSTRAEDYDGG